MREVLGHWERLAAVIRMAGMSTNYFARYIGLPVAENLYRIKRGQNGISRDVADRIVEKFPAISKGWLLTGEGNMFYDEDLQSSQIPYYDSNIEEALSGVATTPRCYLYLPPFKTCELAIKYGEDDEILFVRKIDKESLSDGKEYLFLGKKSLTLHKWSFSVGYRFGKNDLIFVVIGRMSMYE